MRRYPRFWTADSPFPVPSMPLWLLSLLLPLLAALPPGPEALWAQALQDIGTGDRIRVTPSEGTPLEGAFQTLGLQGLTLLDSEAASFTIPVESIRALELAAGRKRGKAALIGGTVGLVAGALLGGLTSGDCVGECGDPYGIGGGGLVEANATAEGAALGGLILGGLGAAVGALFFAPERWVRVNLGPTR
ncbi:MAG: hypothetical protein ACWGSQ_13470 [Longimicrobiales bacterium]